MSSLGSICEVEGCKKKAFVAFSCRCWKQFCSVHRYPEAHYCSKLKEMREERLELLKKSLIKVERDKIDNRM